MNSSSASAGRYELRDRRTFGRLRAAVLALLVLAPGTALGGAQPCSSAPAAGMGTGAAAPQAAPLGTNAPPAETIFARAKAAWRARVDPPYVEYGLLERYTWRNRLHDNWWRGAFRVRDRTVALQRVVVAEQEQARLRGTSIALNLRLHHGAAHADSLDTNPDADAFSILEPLVAPNASFGLSRGEPKADLGEGPGAGEHGTATQATASAAASPSPPAAAAAAASPGVFATDKPLRELARVEAVARDYTIALAGIDRVRSEDAYHLTLVPLRDPKTYRLRDLWVAASNYETLKLSVDGIFNGRPYDESRWTITFVDFAGLAYVQQIRAEGMLRFGLDRYVSGLEYDFVDYSFPPTLPPLVFDRLL